MVAMYCTRILAAHENPIFHQDVLSELLRHVNTIYLRTNTCFTNESIIDNYDYLKKHSVAWAVNFVESVFLQIYKLYTLCCSSEYQHMALSKKVLDLIFLIEPWQPLQRLPTEFDKILLVIMTCMKFLLSYKMKLSHFPVKLCVSKKLQCPPVGLVGHDFELNCICV